MEQLFTRSLRLRPHHRESAGSLPVLVCSLLYLSNPWHIFAIGVKKIYIVIGKGSVRLFLILFCENKLVNCWVFTKVSNTFREASMADRKGRSVTFKVPYEVNSIVNLGDLRTAIEGEIESEIIVFQDLGSSEYLVELNAVSDAESLIEDVL